MTRDIASLLGEDSVQTYNQLVSLLHLFYHRNKNQHRRGSWWRHFSTFRRQLQYLDHDIERLTAKPATHVARARLKAERASLETRVEARLNLWQNVLVARWHRAFSQLAANGRFAALGLVLLAVLSQMCSLTSLTSHYEALAEQEMQDALLQFGREAWPAQLDDLDTSAKSTDAVMTEDVGISLVRSEALASRVETASAMELERDVAPKVKKKKKRIRPKGNAIDDLFDTL